MERQKGLKRMGLAVAFLLFIVEGILLYNIRNEENENIVTVGSVEITLLESEDEKQSEAGERKHNPNQGFTIEAVKPGETIKREPTIIVGKGSQMAYLRTRIVITGLTEYQKSDLLKRIAFAPEWHYNAGDGYYYFQNPIIEGQRIVFFTSVMIPKEWEAMQEILKFKINVMAEAVQSSYLTPKIGADCQMLGWIPTETLTQAKSDLSF